MVLNISQVFCQLDSVSLANTEISILTCRSGDELYSTFGHTAIRIKNSTRKTDRVYNYGLFSFDTPNFYMKFMRGQLPYLLGGTKMEYFLYEYQRDERSVFEQKLNLANAEKGEIINFLEDNAKPENREYAYDFFYDNCATRIVDVYGLAGDEIIYGNKVEEKTFRDLLKENLKSLPWSEFGIDIVIGARADQLTNRRHQMFLPSYLMDNLNHASYLKNNEKIALSTKPELIVDFEDKHKNRIKKSIPWPLIATLLLLIVTIFINLKQNKATRIFNKTLIIISGILGFFLLFMWFGTNHGATRDNWNIMWLNPILIFYLIIVNYKWSKWIKLLVLGLLAISALNCLFTFLPQFMHFAFLPIIASISLAVWKYIPAVKKGTTS